MLSEPFPGLGMELRMLTCRDTPKPGGTQAGSLKSRASGLAVDSDVTSLNMSFLPRHRLMAMRISGGRGSHICYLQCGCGVCIGGPRDTPVSLTVVAGALRGAALL